MKRNSLLLLIIISLSIPSLLMAVVDPNYNHHPKKDVPFTHSNLPIIMIDLNEPMAKKSEERRVFADMKVIWRQDGGINSITDEKNLNYYGKIGIRYRGNTSYTFSSKKPFSFKTWNPQGENIKVSLLGMPKHQDWTFIAPYGDRSLFRDALLFDLMRGTFEYTAEVRYCELVLNGVYQGVYALVARPRKGDDRIDVKKPSADTGDGLTGGYILSIDHTSPPGFFGKESIRDLYENSKNRFNYYQIKYPDEEDITVAQKKYIQGHVWAMEESTASNNFKDPNIGFRAYLDTTSLMNFIISQEITKNVDGYRLSTPMYKYLDSKDSRFFFTVWDFNIGFGNADYADGFSTEGWAFNLNRFSNDGHVPWFFKRVLQDETFYNSLKELWTNHRKSRLSDKNLIQKIDSFANLLQEAQPRDATAWGNNWGSQLWPNYYIPESWEDELDYLKEWILKRVAWIDSQWSSEDVNYVANANLEAVGTRGKNRNTVSLAEWTTKNSVSLSTVNVYDGKYAFSIKSTGAVTQIITELPPGKYELNFMAKTQQDPKANFFIRYFDKNSPTKQIHKKVSHSSTYNLVTLSDIDITNHFIELGFNVDNTAGDVRLWVDAVSLKRVGHETGLKLPKETELDVKLIADRNNLSLRALISSIIPEDTWITIYDSYGRMVFNQKVVANEVSVTDVFMRNQLYIVKVGEKVEKVIF